LLSLQNDNWSMFIKGNAKVNDKLLLLQLKEGSRKAFNALYDQYWSAVYAAAYKRLQDQDLAKDITQDVFLQLWAKRDTLQIENLQAYLYTAIRNKVYNIFEQQRKFTPVPDLFAILSERGDQADAELLKKEFLHAYNTLLESLPATQRKVFRMRYDQGLSTEDIAAQLNISRKTVQNHLSSAVTRMRSSLTAISLLMVLIKR